MVGTTTTGSLLASCKRNGVQNALVIKDCQHHLDRVESRETNDAINATNLRRPTDTREKRRNVVRIAQVPIEADTRAARFVNH